jgi:hypothetical protein
MPSGVTGQRDKKMEFFIAISLEEAGQSSVFTEGPVRIRVFGPNAEPDEETILELIIKDVVTGGEYTLIPSSLSTLLPGHIEAFWRAATSYGVSNEKFNDLFREYFSEQNHHIQGLLCPEERKAEIASLFQEMQVYESFHNKFFAK